MARVVVSGLVNLETTARIEDFPIPYVSVQYPFFGINTTVSGVGYNVACALSLLGNDVRFFSFIGQDQAGELVTARLIADGLAPGGVLACVRQTPQSVIFVDAAGRRMILTDLKDMQDHVYPAASFREAAAEAEMAVVCNINFARHLLSEALSVGVPIATDVHAISDLDDPYNADFMAAASILFMSHEHLPSDAATWAGAVMARYRPDMLVIGLGSSGALLALADGSRHHEPAFAPGPIVNTVGAGDALFSAFVHGLVAHGNPRLALRQAVTYAGHKIGASGGAAGLLTWAELEALDLARAWN